MLLLLLVYMYRKNRFLTSTRGYAHIHSFIQHVERMVFVCTQTNVRLSVQIINRRKNDHTAVVVPYDVHMVWYGRKQPIWVSSRLLSHSNALLAHIYECVRIMPSYSQRSHAWHLLSSFVCKADRKHNNNSSFLRTQRSLAWYVRVPILALSATRRQQTNTNNNHFLRTKNARWPNRPVNVPGASRQKAAGKKKKYCIYYFTNKGFWTTRSTMARPTESPRRSRQWSIFYKQPPQARSTVVRKRK